MSEIQPTPTVIDAKDRINPFDVRDLWEYRELIAFLTWREITVRYKQTVLGIAWFFGQPAISLAVYVLVFGEIIGISSGETPYAVFVFSGLLPWRYFSLALIRGTTSLVANAAIISKVYFPRLTIVIAMVLAPILDFLVSFVLLIGLMLLFGISPLSTSLLLLPVFTLLAIATAFGVSLWLSALNVLYRDIGHLIIFISQMWFYVTPVLYQPEQMPPLLRSLFAINPMSGVVEGFRWALLDAPNPDFRMMAISTGVVVVLVVSGLIAFSRLERQFGDVI